MVLCSNQSGIIFISEILSKMGHPQRLSISDRSLKPLLLLLLGFAFLITTYNIGKTNTTDWLNWGRELVQTYNTSVDLTDDEKMVKVSKPVLDLRRSNITVAIGMAISSKYQSSGSKARSFKQMPLFSHLLPSFCRTASVGFIYNFYLAYDFNDNFFNSAKRLKLLFDKLTSATKIHCNSLGKIDFSFVKCNYSGRPAWAQNDAMMAAYRDKKDFFYRINDDTFMTSSNWTHLYITELLKMDPPLVGVVGPKHSGGNTAILTYDFVHRTHIDIFGFYYPREFPGLYADDWITKVYLPNRSKKLKTVRLVHLLQRTRYHVNILKKRYISSVIKMSSGTLEKYVASK